MKRSEKTVNTKKIPVEYLLNNFIDKDFQSSYKALNFTDSLFFIAKFTIMNNFITPNNVKAHLKSLVGAVFLVVLHVVRFCYLRDTLKRFMNSNTVPLLMCSVEIVYIVATILTYSVNMIQSKNNALLMIKIQQALRSIKSEKNNILKQHKLWNCISIVVIFSVYGSYAGLTVAGSLSLGRGLYSLNSIITAFPDMIFDISIIYGTRTVDLIRKILVSWKNTMLVHKKAQLATLEVAHKEGTTTKTLIQAYMDLLQSFRLCQNVFQFAVSDYIYHRHHRYHALFPAR